MFEGIFQPVHLLLIFVIAVFVFGPKKLPELGKGLGEGIRALKAGLHEVQERPTTALEVSGDQRAEGKGN